MNIQWPSWSCLLESHLINYPTLSNSSYKFHDNFCIYQLLRSDSSTEEEPRRPIRLPTPLAATNSNPPGEFNYPEDKRRTKNTRTFFRSRSADNKVLSEQGVVTGDRNAHRAGHIDGNGRREHIYADVINTLVVADNIEQCGSTAVLVDSAVATHVKTTHVECVYANAGELWTRACFKRKIVGGQRCCPIDDCGRPKAAWGRVREGLRRPLPPRGSGGIFPEIFLKFYMQYPAFWHISDGVFNILDCWIYIVLKFTGPLLD